MLNVSQPWFEVQVYSLKQGWVGECTFSTSEEAKVWAEKYRSDNPWRIVQCFVVFKKGE
jgi:hypothetical protein